MASSSSGSTSNTISSSGSTSIPAGSSDIVAPPPLWNYVTKVEKQPGTGGTWHFECNICHEKRFGSYSRVKAHLLKQKNKGISVCKSVTQAQISEMQRLEDEYENSKKKFSLGNVPLPCGLVGLDVSKKRKSELNPIARAFDLDLRNQLDQEIARMFYTAGLPFNLSRNPHFVRSFAFAANHNLGGYVPPSYNKLRTTLLLQEKANVERLLQPLKGTWPERGVSIVSDGWSDPQRKPLINFMATSGSGPLFIKSVNCFGEVKDKWFISDLMKEVIDEVGHQNVVQILTDNAPNCKAAGEIIEGKYPHIYWTPCVVHTLNLALKNICEPKNTPANIDTYLECSWITLVHNDAMQIKNFIMNHTMRLAIFTKFTPLKLLSIADTRFASVIVMLKRFKLIKHPLKTMIASEEWDSYRDDDIDKARFVKEKINDDEWWEKVNYILEFTAPIYEVIRVCDTDKPTLHLVYEMWDSMIEKVKVAIYKKEFRSLDQPSLFFDKVYAILISRWTKSSTPLHCLAHSLNPRFYSDGWLNEDPARVAPHRDGEISQERLKCFRRLFPSDDDYDKVLDEYANFSLNAGPFAEITSLAKRAMMDPKSWWANFGSQSPLLQGLAFRVLGQPTSSSYCERNWSTYNFIHSLRRNRLTPKRAEDLVFIHNNLRLLSRNTELYTSDEKSKMWDVGGDAFDSLEDSGFLEFAELSLDEPELENILLSGNTYNN